mmetsp:Transcript_2643/g.3963  ORF Transcript_2643/g.3963 Transcript_2643/m.3963 type:complete len:95 (+) Transcript_2643:111-395(+)
MCCWCSEKIKRIDNPQLQADILSYWIGRNLLYDAADKFGLPGCYWCGLFFDTLAFANLRGRSDQGTDVAHDAANYSWRRIGAAYQNCCARTCSI